MYRLMPGFFGDPRYTHGWLIMSLEEGIVNRPREYSVSPKKPGVNHFVACQLVLSQQLMQCSNPFCLSQLFCSEWDSCSGMEPPAKRSKPDSTLGRFSEPCSSAEMQVTVLGLHPLKHLQSYRLSAEGLQGMEGTTGRREGWEMSRRSP